MKTSPVKDMVIGFMLCMTIIFVCDSVFEYLGKPLMLNTIEDNALLFDGVSYIYNCSSDSMGLAMGCGDRAYYTNVEKPEDLVEGKIYLYERDEELIIHRLALCLTLNCSLTVFRGDNNRVGELVNGSQVKYRVDMVEYR